MLCSIMLTVVMLNVVMLNVVILNVFMLCVIKLNVVMLSVVILSVVAPVYVSVSHFRSSLIFEDKAMSLPLDAQLRLASYGVGLSFQANQDDLIQS
jgi:hypothetical protein